MRAVFHAAVQAAIQGVVWWINGEPNPWGIGLAMFWISLIAAFDFLSWRKKKRGEAEIREAFRSMQTSQWTSTQWTSYAQAYQAILGQKAVYKNPVREQRAEAIRGWRAFNIGSDGLWGMHHYRWEAPQLTAICSPLNAFYWSEYSEAAVEGESDRDRCLRHISMGSQLCRCGIYGMAELVPGRYEEEDIQAWARCVAWGTVAVDAEGNFRSSDAELEEVFLMGSNIRKHQPLGRYFDLERLSLDLSIQYGIPVTVVETADELVKVAVAR